MSDNFCGLNNPKLSNCEVFLVHLLHEFGIYGLILEVQSRMLTIKDLIEQYKKVLSNITKIYSLKIQRDLKRS